MTSSFELSHGVGSATGIDPLSRGSVEQVPCRVAFVSETWQPEINGVTHTLGQLVAQLGARGYPMQLVRPRPEDGGRDPAMEAELQVKALPVLDYDGVQMGITSPRRLRDHWRTHRPDVIYIATEGPLGLIALRVARRLGIPVVSGFHTNFDHYSQHYILLRIVRPFVRTFLKRFHNRTQITLVPTSAQAERMTKAGYRNVKVMGRGLDPARFSPRFRDLALRKTWGAGDDDCVALHVGRLAVEKNVTLLIEALEAMRAANPDQIAVIVGDGPLRKEAERRLPWVHFAGFLRDQALARHYASADLFLFPSLSETFGNVVTEAMASGLATLAFDYAAAGELIERGREGVTVACNNPAGFVAAATELAADTERVRAQGRAASARVSSLGWERIAETFIGHLHQAQEVGDARKDLSAV